MKSWTELVRALGWLVLAAVLWESVAAARGQEFASQRPPEGRYVGGPSERVRLPSQRVEVGRPDVQQDLAVAGSAAAAPAGPTTRAALTSGTSLPLPSRSAESRTRSAATTDRPGSSAVTVVSSLALVIGLFFVVAWLFRRAAPRANLTLPSEVVQVLGRTQLAGRQVLQLVRIGHKLVLVAVSANGSEAITEITDKQEVERLCGICERSRPTSISASFRQVMQQFGEDRAPAGFLGDEHQAELQFAVDGQDG